MLPALAVFPKWSSPWGEATLEVEEGQVLTSARLDALNLTNASSLSMTGVLPYAYGNDTATVLLHGGSYTSVEGLDQLADLDAVVLGLVSLPMQRFLALAESDDRSLLMFSGSGFGSENASRPCDSNWFDQQSGLDDVHLGKRSNLMQANKPRRPLVPCRPCSLCLAPSPWPPGCCSL